MADLDVCIGERGGPEQPGLRAVHARSRPGEGPKRVCWNSWIAPHNFEGFFLNFGDMLVKAGEPQRAAVMYGNARLAAEFSTWPYKGLLDDRIANATPERGGLPAPGPTAEGPTMMVRSRYSCMGCHQQ